MAEGKDRDVETTTEEPGPEAPVKDSDGNETEEVADEEGDLGRGQVQHKIDQENIQGYRSFATTVEEAEAEAQPPSREHTVSGVTGNTALQDLGDKGQEKAEKEKAKA